MTTKQSDWKVLARELTGWEVMARLSAGQDIALLPVGSTELHGPQLPLGTDTYIAEALCHLAARRMKGTVFDTVSYTWSGMTRYSRPTVSLPMDAETRYVKAVCGELARVGFKRLYVVQIHGPGIAMMRLAREFFEETGVPLAFYGSPGMHRALGGQLEAEAQGVAWEASLCAAAAELLGVSPTIDPGAKPEGRNRTESPGGAARKAIAETGGLVGWLGTDDLQHGVEEGRVDAALGHRMLEVLADAIARSAPHMAEIRDAWDGVDLPGSWPSTAEV